MQKNKWLKLLFVLGVFSLISLSGYAEVSIDKLRIFFAPNGERFSDITISNSGDHAIYVTNTLSRILNAGQKNQKVETFGGNPMTFGMVVTPNKLVIPPYQERRIRVISLLRNLKQDAVYQLLVNPQEGELVPASLVGDKKAAFAMDVHINYLVQLYVLPKYAQPQISAHRRDNIVDFKNEGNTTFFIERPFQCRTTGQTRYSEKAGCVMYQSVVLYPSTSQTLKLKYNTPLRYQEFYGTNPEQRKMLSEARG